MFMGSVKDVLVIQPPSDGMTGLGKFIFSDRYSVFDWGSMPDEIESKGKALCIIGAYFFEKIEEESDGDIKTHYIGVEEEGKLKKLSEVRNPSDKMVVKLVRVIRPKMDGKGYDYSVFLNQKANYLIPIEVIYRNSLPEGSSVFKRLEKGEITPQDIGLNFYPKPGEKLKKPMLDFSTKLEDLDRYMRPDEAKRISGLSDKEFERLKDLALFADEVISRHTLRAGISNEDGKFEFAFDEMRNLIFVDVLGTPDECRFIKDGVQVSKEVLRKFYRDTEWYHEVSRAKETDKINWRKLVRVEPPRLPFELKKLVSQLYMSCCNEITGREWFHSPPLRDVIRGLKEFFP